MKDSEYFTRAEVSIVVRRTETVVTTHIVYPENGRCVGTAVGNKVYLQDVLVAEIEVPFVLGYDFMYKNNCLLDIGTGT